MKQQKNYRVKGRGYNKQFLLLSTGLDVMNFYRATRMHSADYAVARCLSVCLSVCHTPVLSLNGYTYPQSVFTIG